MVVAAEPAQADYIEAATLPCHMACTHADWRNPAPVTGSFGEEGTHEDPKANNHRHCSSSLLS